MKTRSAKNKGKRLEKWIKSQLLTTFTDLTDDDIRTTVGAETGADLKLSAKARLLIPYQIESKNQERVKYIYDFYEQAQGHGNLTPLVIICMNRQKPLAIVDAEHFIKMIKETNVTN